MRCAKCGFKKDLGKGATLLLTCPKCGTQAGAGFDIHEVSINEKDNSKNWTPWIIGGSIVIVLIIGIIAYFSLRKKKE